MSMSRPTELIGQTSCNSRMSLICVFSYGQICMKRKPLNDMLNCNYPITSFAGY